ncbi:uncharacterized protein LOC112591944 [Melanaphis sacchari]|uniref:uncharacterized protein LOC112591944 n=1 Tax=Melanaphis sacchari TaxID=742174 RepID=UPI000DC13C80|nr:uncharacterized protein LOC112591944 [Melanaphis sacchari]
MSNDNVIKYYYINMSCTENEELLFPLTDYFEDTWISRPNRRRTRRPPTFSLALWNQYDATLADLPKTNNSVEGWHRAFSSLLGASHPTIWRLIDVIKKRTRVNGNKNQSINSRARTGS